MTMSHITGTHERSSAGRPGAGRGAPAARGVAGVISLAAAPTFAIMALLAGGLGGGPADGLCAATRDGSLWGGMVPMYALMSVFHLAPWLKLVSR